MTKHFEHLFVFGRPAGGKSEFIDFMKNCESAKRLNQFHIAPFDIIDDYLFIKEIAEHEDILEKLSFPVKRMMERTSDGIAVSDDIFWSYAPIKMNMVLEQKYLPNQKFYDEKTLLIEFSRGTDLWSYQKTLSELKPEGLKHGAIIYVKVTFEESLRRNEARYQEKLKHSILAHKCPEKIMYKYYKNDDWGKITENKSSGFLKMNGIEIPFVTMENEPEEKDLTKIEKRYKTALDILHELWLKKNN